MNPEWKGSNETGRQAFWCQVAVLQLMCSLIVLEIIRSHLLLSRPPLAVFFFFFFTVIIQLFPLKRVEKKILVLKPMKFNVL